MVRFILFLLLCIPSYFVSLFVGQLVMDDTKNVFFATEVLASSFAVLMIISFCAATAIVKFIRGRI